MIPDTYDANFFGNIPL